MTSNSKGETMSNPIRGAFPDLATVGKLGEQLAPLQVTKAQVLAYLRGGHLVRSSLRLMEDKATGQPGKIPDQLWTDGEWRWHQELAYQVEHHEVQVPDDFLRHMIERSFKPTSDR
jgi:hypothetical protein